MRKRLEFDLPFSYNDACPENHTVPRPYSAPRKPLFLRFLETDGGNTPDVTIVTAKMFEKKKLIGIFWCIRAKTKVAMLTDSLLFMEQI